MMSLRTVMHPGVTACAAGINPASSDASVPWEGGIPCLMPESEYPLLKESGRLRDYDRVWAANHLFLWNAWAKSSISLKREEKK